jgi:hypothetical protein
MPIETSSVGGAKVLAALGGFLGSAVGLALSKSTPRHISIVYLICGALFGGGIASLVSWAFDVPQELYFYLGALFGVPGTGLAYTIIGLLRDPIKTIKDIRGLK